MNKIFYIIGFFIVSVFFTACDKDTENISSVTNYVVLSMKGDDLMILNKGETFTDPGVTGMEGDSAAEVVVAGSVDTTQGGIYKLDYSAVNKDGYAASVVRYVIVMDIASIAGNDYSGKYERTYYGSAKSGTFSDWTATSDAGVYKVMDVGGVDAGSYEYEVTVYNVKDNMVVFPVQANALGGSIYATSTKGGKTPDLIVIDNGVKYLWSVKGSGYGTNLRTFEKR